LSDVSRRRIGGLLAVAALLGGCTEADSDHPRPAVTRSAAPAAAAGGACRLLDYAVVAQTLGATFDVAAASQSGSSVSCVLQTRTASYPDLELTVAPTKADVKAFRTAVMPKGAATVPGLGRIGYSAAAPPLDAAGPGVEVSWLTGNGKLLLLRYRLAGDAAPELATAATPKLVQLALQLDTGGS
jgi:hypothetical protein